MEWFFVNRVFGGGEIEGCGVLDMEMNRKWKARRTWCGDRWRIEDLGVGCLMPV